MENEHPGVAIIGLAGRFPGADNLEQFWDNLRQGRESIRRFTRDELLTAGHAEALIDMPGFVPAAPVLQGIDLFDAKFFGYSPREAELMDPQFRLFLEAAWEALETAGYDSARFDGRIGIYAGSSVGSYFMHNLSGHWALLSRFGGLRIGILNKPDNLPTTIAYKLDLRGAAVFVATQCSTSLVAVYLACQSLANHECDMVLAGGVSVHVPAVRGYRYEAESILSPDGHCRPFDASANGTVLGDGLGIVVLKRLEDAVADGDTIHAVLRGWAINNEGARRAGYAAPSVEAQAEVIAEAMTVAEISADDIGYVEAHGTGTLLGDPIELSALTEAFRLQTQRVGFCGLGSVKSNIGHADHAAGIAGLIKATLAVQRGEIPATLHYETINPHFDLEKSPFFVAKETIAWPTGEPRRASVSSMGIGGTNAHVVLEQAPAPRAPAPATREHQLVVLSAKTPGALRSACERWADRVAAAPADLLPDIAHTSRLGRRAFPYRIAVAGASVDAIASALRSARPPARPRPDHVRGVVFGFPGQGAQYAGMAVGLYQSEPVFRTAFDECSRHCKSHLDIDLTSVVFADPRDEGTSARLQQTLYTQPAVFAVSYALAQLWRSMGIEPAACIGHSLGEYVAACVSEVMSLEDAMRVVCARARLMSSVKPGTMVVVPRGPQDVMDTLDPAVELAGHNAPDLTVVAGPTAAIDAWLTRMPQAGWGCRRLPVSHAFHTAMMEPILDAFASVVASVRLNEPRIPYVSNLTGSWITREEARDPQYYVQHLRGTVRFAKGIETLCSSGGRVFLEVGPGESMTALVRAQLAADGQHAAVASLPRRRVRGEHDQAAWLAALGALWVHGVDVAWERLTAGEARRRVPLPTYPFERKRFWIEPAKMHGDAEPPPARDDATPEDEQVDPRARAEQRVIAIWCDLLGVESPSAQDHFMEQGGHSLLATQLVQQVREQTGIALSLRDFLEKPTIAGILERFEPAPSSDSSTADASEERDEFEV